MDFWTIKLWGSKRGIVGSWRTQWPSCSPSIMTGGHSERHPTSRAIRNSKLVLGVCFLKKRYMDKMGKPNKGAWALGRMFSTVQNNINDHQCISRNRWDKPSQTGGSFLGLPQYLLNHGRSLERTWRRMTCTAQTAVAHVVQDKM